MGDETNDRHKLARSILGIETLRCITKPILSAGRARLGMIKRLKGVCVIRSWNEGGRLKKKRRSRGKMKRVRRCFAVCPILRNVLRWKLEQKINPYIFIGKVRGCTGCFLSLVSLVNVKSLKKVKEENVLMVFSTANMYV